MYHFIQYPAHTSANKPLYGEGSHWNASTPRCTGEPPYPHPVPIITRGKALPGVIHTHKGISCRPRVELERYEEYINSILSWAAVAGGSAHYRTVR